MTDTLPLFNYHTFCVTSNLQKIRDFLRGNLEEKNVNDKEQNLIILAVDEICSNSIIHGNKENSSSTIDVSIRYEADLVVIDIKDQGLTFDYGRYSEPTIDQLIMTKQKGSMGLMLVKKIMDKIEFFTENGTNVCRLVRRRTLA